MNKNSEKAYLLLANGALFEGEAMGARGETIGEVVFTTGMTAYQETLTDPSYYGQIVTQTFPLIGNYGTNSEDNESDSVYLNGYIVREYCEYPSNFRCEETINSFLCKNNVIGICNIDTRSLTKILRENGVMNGMITTTQISDKQEALKKINSFNIVNPLKATSCSEKSVVKALNEKKYSVTLIDYGHKKNIINQLTKRGCEVTVMPYDADIAQIMAQNPDAIMLSNGAGDPALNIKAIETIKKLIEKKIPIFGISLGHQLLALANNATTIKLKHGHRGANQPVIDYKLDKTFITSQNHGYAVDIKTLDKSIGDITHINANDKSCEGIKYKNSPALSVQFIPEVCGGPQDTSYLYDEFLSLINK